MNLAPRSCCPRRPRAPRWLLVALPAIVAWCGMARSFANPTRGGEIWLPQPEALGKVQLRTVTVALGLAKVDGLWSGQIVVEAYNPTKAETIFHLLLPERPCDQANEVCNGAQAGRYEGLAVTADGAAVTVQEQTEVLSVPWWPTHGRVWRFAVALPPRKAVLIEVQWQLAPTIDADGHFATVHGLEAWARKIKSLEFALSLPFRPWTLGVPASWKLRDYTTTLGTHGALAGKPETRIVLQAKGWKAKETFAAVHIGTSAQLGGAVRCPDPRTIADAAEASDATAKLKQLLVMRTDDELADCRALYLARQGFPFVDKELRARFYGKPVASASVTITDTSGKYKPFIRFGFQPNAAYSPSLHPREDAALIDALASELQRRRGH